jgi:hypothetical protein
MEFCEWYCMQEHPWKRIVFSDEAIFYLNGHVNRHNCRYWCDNNPRWMEDSHVQNDPRVMVWAAIWHDRIIGPYFFGGNVTGETYLHMLQTFLEPILDNIPLSVSMKLFFQQDGAPPHFSLAVREYLTNTFGNQWIGRRGHVEWPPRSPDLTPLDYFLWGHLKSVVYQTRPTTIDELKEKITLECSKITPDMLQNVLISLSARAAKCIEVGGNQFEHLLK